MSKITIMSTSATMNYLIHVEKLTMKEIRIILGMSLKDTRLLLRGKKDFTKQNYIDIITNFPLLETRIEMFENVKLGD